MGEFFIGNIRGAEGPAGPVGPSGESAYEIAVRNGYAGTEEEWLEGKATLLETWQIWQKSDTVNNTAAFGEWLCTILRQTAARCSGVFQNTSVAAYAIKELTPIVAYGDAGMVQGNKFVAPVSGLYVFSGGTSRTNAATAHNVALWKNAETVNTSYKDYDIIALAAVSVSSMPGICACTWLNEGEFLKYTLQPSAAISTINEMSTALEFEFALLNSSADFTDDETARLKYFSNNGVLPPEEA